ncbi:MAG TPA: hydrogenase maturation nickel metallochaperone HypA [Candidatus Eisenbacteria bacterium]|jgi:Zn finger protein HypA/HybF involved in hydrogenase expression
MHEYTVVLDLVDRILGDPKPAAGKRVTEVRLRRGSTFAEGPLRLAFEILARGTALEGATLTVEEFAVEVECQRCHEVRRITADDLIGHLFICPDCGESREVDEAHGLELVGVTTG